MVGRRASVLCCMYIPVFLFIVNSNSGIENSGENWGLYGDASCYVTEGKTPEWARKVKSGACVCHWGNADRQVILWTFEAVAERIETDACLIFFDCSRVFTLLFYIFAVNIICIQNFLIYRLKLQVMLGSIVRWFGSKLILCCLFILVISCLPVGM